MRVSKRAAEHFICQQEVQIDEEVDVIISEWMGYMLLYEVFFITISLFSNCGI